MEQVAGEPQQAAATGESRSVSRAELRRRRLLLATSAAGGVALAGTVYPFLASLEPSERALAAGAPVEVRVDALAPGAIMTVEWRGKPVWILHRTPDMIARVQAGAARVSDPDSRRSDQPAYCKNVLRARRADYFVAVGICTHLGCVPTLRADVAPADLGPDWQGGFYCPCHGSKFDLAGRVFRNVPAPLNLVVPPYRYLDPSTMVIGDDGSGKTT